MTIWVCDNGHEFEVEGETIPTECPVCGCTVVKEKPPQPPSSLIKPPH